MPTIITNNDLVLLALTPDGINGPFCNSYHVAELVRVLNSKRNTCGLDYLNLNGVTTVFKNDTDYEYGPGGGPADIAEDVDYDVSPRDAGAFREYLIAMHGAIEETANATLIYDGYPYRWRTLGDIENLPYEYPASWQTQGFTEEAAKEPHNWYAYFLAMRDTINSLIIMTAQEISVTFSGPFDNVTNNGSFADVIVPEKLRHEAAERSPGGSVAILSRTIIGGINFVYKEDNFPYEPRFWPKSPSPDEWFLLWDALRKEYGTTAFEYQWINGAKVLVSTGFGVNAYDGLTAENFFDVVESFEAWQPNGGTSAPGSSSGMGAAEIHIPAFVPLRTRILNNDYPSDDGWHAVTPRPACVQKTTYTVTINGASGIPVRLKIPYSAYSKCFNAVGGWEANPPYTMKIELYDDDTTVTKEIFPSSDEWKYGEDSPDFLYPPFYGDKKVWKLYGMWEPVITPTSDTASYTYTREIVGANPAAFLDDQLQYHLDGIVTRRRKTIDGVVVRSDVWQARVIDPSLATEPEYNPTLGGTYGLPEWGGRYYRHVSQFQPVPGRYLQTVEVVNVGDKTKAYHHITASDKIIALDMMISAGVPTFKEVVA